ncbi:cytochrome c oxidase cbb3-type subunit 3 [Pseudarcicella hirudinis]|uniref:Cytochrome c oxidase cbb3-type subunit 3 n=1 Tax=Pseudarcicella hirudinis TaxID=1079859 RepID=A0A1I5NVX6_9BACT|nr:cbb3-type cytochrome c oxidase N-terminal domain-containing protein [Pseudarcicella hirudinis]SFP25944.1 cytochrome c oxidase cbb3-type subunit 3 [Pseudarcicella hirudinis]
MKRILSFLSVLIIAQQAFGADAQTNSVFHIKTGEELLMVSIVGILVLFSITIAVITFSINQRVNHFIKGLHSEKDQELEEAMANRTLWQKIAGLKPISYEKKLVIPHDFDGIYELDNPTPAWFMYLFYGSILVGVVYFFAYHVVGNGKVMENEYAEETAIAEKARENYMKKFANSVNENNVVVLKDAKGIDEGKKIYTQNCVACHGEKAEGKVGPNLTDEYWLHGGKINQVFHTITNGVPEKGMIAWNKTLNPIQIQQVASFILSLQGTNPPGAKEPQGEK